MVSAGVINFLISCIIILIFTIFGGVGVSIHLLWLPVITIIQSALTLGLLFILSAINVYVRDVEYIVGFFINLLFYATPILYTADMFPERARWLLYLNPMTHLIDAYRQIFYYHANPNIASLIYIIALSFLLLIVGYMIFNKLEKGFAEEV